jgi:transcriptional regulator with XRE-family HTH domain
MRHQDYVNERSRREPRFQAERQAAAAELALGEALVLRRHERGVSLADLADVTGISEARLESIEEGDSMTLHEFLWLLHALETGITIEPGFRVSPRVLVR